MGLCISAAGGESAKRVTKLKGTMCVALLGIQGSGKSTFAKQMKILNCGGFEPSEKESYRNIIRKNFLLCIQELSTKTEEFSYEVDGENMKFLRYFKALSIYDTEWDDKLVEKMKRLFNDKAIIKTREDLTWKPQIRADYLLDHFDRLTGEDYQPTEEDILVSRQRTTGQTTTTFIKDKWKWELIDLGGQESERDKWDEVFNMNNISAVIFLAALDEFNTIDSKSGTDNKITSMQVSMDTFKEVMNRDKMKDITRILFLNKTDLLQKKINSKENFEDFKKKFPDYKGEQSGEAVREFIKEKYSELIENQDPFPLQAHFTCALDTKAIDHVFEAVRSTIMVKRLQGMGMVL